MKKMISNWLASPFIPPPELTIQASGVCFTSDHCIILVSDGKNWMLPGGAPEKNESLEQTLIREVAEEACSTVLDFRYIGSIKNEIIAPDPKDKTALTVNYKARYWVRVEQGIFSPQHEIKDRIEVRPEQFVDLLGWNAQKTAGPILKKALSIEKRRMLTEYQNKIEPVSGLG